MGEKLYKGQWRGPLLLTRMAGPELKHCKRYLDVELEGLTHAVTFFNDPPATIIFCSLGLSCLCLLALTTL
jgi:hypothetical protein